MPWVGWPPRTVRYPFARWRRPPGYSREARNLHRYGIEMNHTTLDYGRLLERVREVVAEVGEHSVLRSELQDAGVVLYEHAGTARFVDPHTIDTAQGVRLRTDKIVLCAGGTHRPLPVPGAELAGSHRDAWALTAVPESLLVIGAGATGVQVASVFAELGSRVTLFEAGPRILATEDEDVSRTMAASLHEVEPGGDKSSTLVTICTVMDTR